MTATINREYLLKLL